MDVKVIPHARTAAGRRRRAGQGHGGGRGTSLVLHAGRGRKTAIADLLGIAGKVSVFF